MVALLPLLLYGTLMQPDVCISAFFDAPVVNHNWQADRRQESLVRFGLLWQIYDMVASLGLSFRPPILEDTSQCERSHWWLLGGVSGTEYLVSSRGLIQPRARSGIIAPGFRFDRPEHDITITHIHHKTLGVPDCQCVWDFIQSEGRKHS